MKTILIVLMMAVTVTAQTVTKVGKDSEGTEWFTFTETIKQKEDGRYLAGMHTAPKRRGAMTLVFVELDCSDNTLRLLGVQLWKDGKKEGSLYEKTEWATPKGIGKNLYDLVCHPNKKVVVSQYAENKRF